MRIVIVKINENLSNHQRFIWKFGICQIICKISRKTDARDVICCLIIDDTDLPKFGYKAECLGKVSHTAMTRIQGFKSIFLCDTDRKTQLMLDSMIQAEKGKDKDRPQGLTKKQKSSQYAKLRGRKVRSRLCNLI